MLLQAIATDLPPTPSWAFDELVAEKLTYTYVTLSTLVLFTLVGHILGAREDELEAGAMRDPLTGLTNRGYGERRLAEEAERAARYGSALSVLMIDVDGLKTINDRGGHQRGDAAIRTVAAALLHCARSTDVLVRWGGDELLVAAPSTTAADATELAERVCDRVRTSHDRGGEAPRMTVSIGVAGCAPGSATSPEALYRAADVALYRAKAAGRDRVVTAPLACE